MLTNFRIELFSRVLSTDEQRASVCTSADRPAASRLQSNHDITEQYCARNLLRIARLPQPQPEYTP